MKILLFGAFGQLGTAIREVGKEYEIDVVNTFVDISDEKNIKKILYSEYSFDVAVNVAAFTHVDKCEQEEFSAFLVNALGAKFLAQRIENSKKYIYVSTDYVFSGNGSYLCKETDTVCPINAYGRTKWAGEVFVRAICPKHFIVRTAWLYGFHGKNFVKTILKKARETGRISVVADQYGSPTYANDLAGAILQLAQTDQYGTYHCTNAGVCSWFELASTAVDIAGIPCEKEAITTEEYRRRFPQSARRPMYSALDNTKIAGVLGKPLRPWRDALEEFIDALQKEEAQNAGN